MSDYSFESLSSYDFEKLVSDLISAELGRQFSNFKSGRDRGIDLRYSSPSDSSEIIIQAKHYSQSKFSTLLSHLKNSEVPKVAALKPRHYIVATSLGTNPDESEKIKNLFASCVHESVNVYNRSDLNALLRKFPEIEKAHYKLWLTSTSVLEKVLKSNLYSKNARNLDSIRQRLQLYVQTQSFSEAVDKLEQQRVCIVAGMPGIGKTTLAEMILIHYLNEGFEPITITSHISEADSFPDEERKIIYFYDDFLGQTSLCDKLSKNEDQYLLTFMKSVERNPDKRMILTTREYILNQAKETYEPLHRANLEPLKYVVNLDSYRRVDRANILLNHIEFSTLRAEFRKNVSESGLLLKIVDHKNFNPRVIESLTQNHLMLNVEPDDFSGALLRNLDNPEIVWKYAFDSHISYESRIVLFILFSYIPNCNFEKLEKLLGQYLAAEESTLSFREKFSRSIRELDGSFLMTNKISNEIVVGFSNPSVRDFIKMRLRSDSDLCIKLIGNCIENEALAQFSGLISEGFDNVERRIIAKAIKDQFLKISDSIDWNCRSWQTEVRHIFLLRPFLELDDQIEVARLVGDVVVRGLKTEDGWFDSIVRIFSIAAQWKPFVTKEGHAKIESALRLPESCNLGIAIVSSHQGRLADLDDFTSISEFVSKVRIDAFPAGVLDQLKKSFIQYCDNEDFHPEDIGGSDDFENLASELEDIAEILGVDIESCIDELREKAEELEEEEQSSFTDFEGYEKARGPSRLSSGSDAEILSMFEPME